MLGLGAARGQNLIDLQKEIVLCQSFLDNHLSESIFTWKIDTMISMTSTDWTPGFMPGGGGGEGREVKI